MVDPKEIEKLSDLARVGVSEEEKEEFSGEIDSVLEYVSHIDNALEDFQADKKEGVGPLKNVLREDLEPHESGQFSKDLLDQAPSKEGDYFKVKKIL